MQSIFLFKEIGREEKGRKLLQQLLVIWNMYPLQKSKGTYVFLKISPSYHVKTRVYIIWALKMGPVLGGMNQLSRMEVCFWQHIILSYLNWEIVYRLVIPVMNVSELASRNIKNCNVYIAESQKVGKASWMETKMIYIVKSPNDDVLAHSSIAIMSIFPYDKKVFIIIDTSKRARLKKTRKKTKAQLVQHMQILGDNGSEPLDISAKKVKGFTCTGGQNIYTQIISS